uniref:Uncharacterized protein n=1 Tax=Solanum tuberosum TaxID=4113 RepID=M1ANF7_SOLTU
MQKLLCNQRNEMQYVIISDQLQMIQLIISYSYSTFPRLSFLAKSHGFSQDDQLFLETRVYDQGSCASIHEATCTQCQCQFLLCLYARS